MFSYLMFLSMIFCHISLNILDCLSRKLERLSEKDVTWL